MITLQPATITKKTKDLILDARHLSNLSLLFKNLCDLRTCVGIFFYFRKLGRVQM